MAQDPLDSASLRSSSTSRSPGPSLSARSGSRSRSQSRDPVHRLASPRESFDSYASHHSNSLTHSTGQGGRDSFSISGRSSSSKAGANPFRDASLDFGPSSSSSSPHSSAQNSRASSFHSPSPPLSVSSPRPGLPSRPSDLMRELAAASQEELDVGGLSMEQNGGGAGGRSRSGSNRTVRGVPAGGGGKEPGWMQQFRTGAFFFLLPFLPFPPLLPSFESTDASCPLASTSQPISDRPPSPSSPSQPHLPPTFLRQLVTFPSPLPPHPPHLHGSSPSGSGWFAPLATPTVPLTREERDLKEKQRIEALKAGGRGDAVSLDGRKRPGLMKRMSSGVEMLGFGGQGSAR